MALAIGAVVITTIVPFYYQKMQSSKINKYQMEAQMFYSAVQAAVIEQWSTSKEYYNIANQYQYQGERCGIISDDDLAFAQKNSPVKSGECSLVEVEISKSILEYLESSDYHNGKYQFSNIQTPQGISCTEYEQLCDQPGIVIGFNKEGVVNFMEYVKGGYLVIFKHRSCK